MEARAEEEESSSPASPLTNIPRETKTLEQTLLSKGANFFFPHKNCIYSGASLQTNIPRETKTLARAKEKSFFIKTASWGFSLEKYPDQEQRRKLFDKTRCGSRNIYAVRIYTFSEYLLCMDKSSLHRRYSEKV